MLTPSLWQLRCRDFLKASTLALFTFATGCSFAAPPVPASLPVTPPALDQSTPTAGLLAFLGAIESGNAAAVRQCMVASPRHEQWARDTADLYAAQAHLHHAVESRFPGQAAGISFLLDGFSDAGLAEAKRYFANAKPTIDGETATFNAAERDENEPARLIHQTIQLRKDQAKWRVDAEAPPAWGARLDGYPPVKGKDNDTGLAMIFLLHEGAEGLQQLARDIESGKLTTIGDVEKVAQKVAADADASAQAKMEKNAATQTQPAKP